MPDSRSETEDDLNPMKRKKNQKTAVARKKVAPSFLSRNYSGSSAYYTPVFLMKCILNGINHFLYQDFKVSQGITSPQVEFLDPAAGDMGFIREHLKFAFDTLESRDFDQWLRNVFVKQVYGFEINPKAIEEGKEKLYFYSKNNPQFYPKLRKTLFDHLFLRNPLENPANSEIDNSIIPTNSQNILVIYGNPPYAVSSTWKGTWIKNLIQDYKTHLNRPHKKKIVGLKGIQDDYVKFLRYCQWLLADNNQRGILAFVINNYFLDGDIFRGLRISLKKSFDKIYIVNLFGDPKKTPPNEILEPQASQDLKMKMKKEKKKQKDENIFEIQTGICLLFAIRKKSGEKGSGDQIQSKSPRKDHENYVDKKRKSLVQNNVENEHLGNHSLAEVYYASCYGSIERKKTFCMQDFHEIVFQKVLPRIDHQFIPLSQDLIEREWKYFQFPYITEIFQDNIIGVQSLHDSLVTHPDRAKLIEILDQFYDHRFDSHIVLDARGQKWVKHNGVVFHDARDWKIQDGLNGNIAKAKLNIQQWQWRGLDRWWVCYDAHLMTKGSSSYSLMQFMYPSQQNLAILLARTSRKVLGDNSVFLTNILAESHCIEGGSGIGDYIFPLKINLDRSKKSNWENPAPATDFNFTSAFLNSLPPGYYQDPFEIFSYIYAILWTPCYRNKYQVFIKSDFPHIPFAQNSSHFHEIARLGGKLVQLHSFQQIPDPRKILNISSEKTPNVINPGYDNDSKTLFFNIANKRESFWISNLSKEIWEFEIGGYPQLSQFLKHRRNRSRVNSTKSLKYQFSRPLNEEELEYFLKMCIVIQQTLEIQPQLDQAYSLIQDLWL